MKKLLLVSLLLLSLKSTAFGYAVNDSCQNAVLLTAENPGASFTPLQQDLGTANNTCGHLWDYAIL
jgi:hypothetical protein